MGNFAISMDRKFYLFLLLVVLLLLSAMADVCCGSVWISPWSVIGDLSPMYRQILLNLRLPKMLTALIAGSALSVAGLMMQTLFRNPLAGPYILGVSSGAGLGVAILTMCSVVLPTVVHVGQLGIAFAAIVGSTLVLLLVLGISSRVRNSVSLLIVGMMIGSIAGAMVNLIQNFANPDALKMFIVWTLGSLGGVGWSEIPILVIVFLLGILLAILLIKPLNGLLLGEEYAQSIGVNVGRIRVLMVLATGLLAGGVTAFCGPIAFIGVAVPHIARGLFRTSNHRVTIPASMLVGAILLLICDVLCNIGTYPLPISTMSALFGAPIIIWIILRK